MLERMEIAKYIYEGVVEPSYKNLPEQMPTVLVTAGKREEKPPRHGLSPIRVRDMIITGKGM